VVVLTGAVAFILLLACVNVAGLQLARGSTRHAELAVRASLGAGRGRLLRQLMIENVVLAAAGALLGLALAWASLDVLVANLWVSLPSNAPVTLNTTVLAACAAVTLATAILFGLVPALRLSRVRVGAALTRAGGRDTTSLSRRSSQLLMAAEIALAVVLVVGAALMLRSFARVLSVDVGFDPDAIVTMEVVPVATDAATHQQYYSALVRDLRLIPGVEAVGAVDFLPLGGGSSFSGVRVGEESHFVETRSVLPGYVEALGIPVVAGRTLTDNDHHAGARVAMLNESVAREMFPDGSAVGRSFTRQTIDDQGNRIDVDWEVIGVISGVRHNSPMRDGGNEIFFPYEASASDAEQGRGLAVVVRPGEYIPDLVNRLRETAEAVGPRVLVESVRTGSDHLADRIVTPRRRTVLLSLLGGLGLALALVGVFGLTAYTVARRTREIGVRMAFGARPNQEVGRIVRDAALPVAVGVIVGLLGAIAATRVIESFLFETAPTDPLTFAVVAVVLALAGCVAAWIPARRAVRIDPVAALRAE
jgi:predicted permease